MNECYYKEHGKQTMRFAFLFVFLFVVVVVVVLFGRFVLSLVIILTELYSRKTCV